MQNVQLDMLSVYPCQWEISHTWIFSYIWICSSHSLWPANMHSGWVGITPVECFTLKLLDYFWWFSRWTHDFGAHPLISLNFVLYSKKNHFLEHKILLISKLQLFFLGRACQKMWNLGSRTVTLVNEQQLHSYFLMQDSSLKSSCIWVSVSTH